MSDSPCHDQRVGDGPAVEHRLRRRALFISPNAVGGLSGIIQMQRQLLSALCSVYGGSVDMLSLGASVGAMRKDLEENGLCVRVVWGLYPFIARLNTILWYGIGAIFCNKLHWIDRFYFPLRTPLPRAWIDRYDLIVCFYPWGHRLLCLERAGGKVIADLADIMANRHERIGTRRWISITSQDESAIFHSGARCLAASKSDAEEFEQLYGVRPSVVSYVPAEWQHLLELAAGERPHRIGFMGATSYVNEEIMRLLARPEFLRCIADAGVELVVAGGICKTVDPSVLQRLAVGGARILGSVPSVLDYYEQVGVTLNPVGPSTGVKIKSIETLIAGRTLITTRWGVDASLYDAFPGQIVCTDWPIDPADLGSLAVNVIRSAVPGSVSAIKAYIEESTKRVRELHTL